MSHAERLVRHKIDGYCGRVILQKGKFARVAWNLYGPDGKDQQILINPSYVLQDDLEDFDPQAELRDQIAADKLKYETKQKENKERLDRIREKIGQEDFEFLTEYFGGPYA